MSNLNNEMNMQPQSDDEEIEKEEQEEADEEYQFSASELDIRSEEEFEEERRREKATLLERLRRLREPHLRRKMVLLEPCIPWEFGSNKYDSQKGTGGFGRIRDATTKVHSSKQLASLGDAADIPILSRAGFATQAGHTAFGSIRDQITKVLEHEGEPKKRCQELLSSPSQTGCQLSLWARPNPEAKNQKLFGSKRQEVGHCVGGRPWTHEELARSRAALPRLWRVNDTAAARDGRHAVRGLSTGFVSHRQATTMVQGLDRSVEDQLESNRCQSWLGGQLLLQTQSRTGGFQKPRDVVNTSYYARLLSESGILPRQSSRNREEQQKGQHVKEGEAPAVSEALRLAGKEEKQQEENSKNRKTTGGYGQR